MKLHPGRAEPQLTDPKLAERFLNKAQKMPSGCWCFTGCSDRKGYGRIRYRGFVWWAHRLSYALFVGPIPAEMHIHHTCATKDCVNPAHLEIATPSENSKERWSR